MLELDEKRSYTRMNVDCKLTYRFIDSDQHHFGQCANLSGAGIAFFTEKEIELGKALEVKITPLNRITPPMTAYIEVVRVNKVQDNKYEIAGSIQSIKAEGLAS